MAEDKTTPSGMQPRSKRVLEDATEAVITSVYDQGTRLKWGDIRLHRLQGQPDVLLLEASHNGMPWKPVMMLTAIGDRLAIRQYGVRSGDPEQEEKTPDGIRRFTLSAEPGHIGAKGKAAGAEDDPGDT